MHLFLMIETEVHALTICRMVIVVLCGETKQSYGDLMLPSHSSLIKGEMLSGVCSVGCFDSWRARGVLCQTEDDHTLS